MGNERPDQARCRHPFAFHQKETILDAGIGPAVGGLRNRAPIQSEYCAPYRRPYSMAEERVQRRLAAIVALDVAGYSRLMEQDEAGTLAALRGRRREILVPAVARHQGRIVKVMGDGVLMEFGSAVNAVACSVELQNRFVEANSGVPDDRRIVMRIGINLGDVIVDGGDLYGDGVNVAARLQSIAAPGGICISGSVHDQVKRKLD